MTVTKRKTNSRDGDTRSTSKAGIQYTCDACSADISHTVRIRCAHINPAASPSTATGAHIGPSLVCDNFDLCGRCFCEGKEVGRHKRWHDYRVVEQHAIPIFTDDWGADEELLLIDACQTYGLGNWADIADRVGNGRTKEEVERHYLDTYISSEEFPLPPAQPRFEIDQEEFQLRKKIRIETVQARPLQIPPPKPMASGPSNHEIGGFMPGRLDFETEWENDAETSIKDLAFGLVYKFGGDTQPEKDPDAEDPEEVGPPPPSAGMAASSRGMGLGSGAGKVTQRKDDDTKDGVDPLNDEDDEDDEPLSQQLNNLNALNSQPTSHKNKNGNSSMASEDIKPVVPAPAPVVVKKEKEEKKPAAVPDKDDDDDEGPIVDEEDDDLELKLAILEIYNARYDKRMMAKAVVFDRNLLEYKKIQAAERKMPKEQRDLITRIKPFARLQTAMDHEKFQDGLLYETTLRKRIAELQEYRRMGITTLAEGERYDKEKAARLAMKQREYMGFDRLAARKPRASGGFDDFGSREGTPSSKVFKRPAPIPLSLATAESLHLLEPSEVLLCSRLQILPKPFLLIKELFFREFARRGGSLTRETATRLVPLSTEGIGEGGESRLEAIWDFYLGGAESGSGGEEEDPEPEDSSSEDDAEIEASLQGSMLVKDFGADTPRDGSMAQSVEDVIMANGELKMEPNGVSTEGFSI